MKNIIKLNTVHKINCQLTMSLLLIVNILLTYSFAIWILLINYNFIHLFLFTDEQCELKFVTTVDDVKSNIQIDIKIESSLIDKYNSCYIFGLFNIWLLLIDLLQLKIFFYYY